MSESKTLEERLAYLEEQNEGLKRVGGLLVGLVVILGVALFMVNQSIVKGVTTDSVIFSNQGRPRAGVTAMPNGHLGVVFYNYAGGVQPVDFEKVPPMDGIVLYDQTGKPRILMGIDERNIPMLALLGPDGRPLFSAIKPEQYKELMSQPGAGVSTGAPAQGGQAMPAGQGGLPAPNPAQTPATGSSKPATPAAKPTP